jgi:hypothetical protein
LRARPVRTVSQVAAALDVTDDRAELLLVTLEFMDIAERVHGGYRATGDAWERYPRPSVRGQVAA